MKLHGKKAFTLMELMIVLVIMALMMLMAYAPYNFYQQKAKVKIASKEIAQSIYEARNLAISGINIKKEGSSDFENKSIGVHFKKGEQMIQFYEFPHTQSGAEVNVSNIETTNGKKLRKKDLQRFIELTGASKGDNTYDNLFLFFEAITGNIFIRGDNDAININTPLHIHFGIRKSNSELLNKKIEYFPKTNTINYKN